MTLNEAKEWFKSFYECNLSQPEAQDKEVIICPPFHLIPSVFNLIMNQSGSNILMLKLGSQNISPFKEGAYTGEVSARQLKDFCSYSIIGHSERRQYFYETDEMLSKKVNLLNSFNITPIYCVQGMETSIPKGVSVIAYEPVFAIGSGKPDTPSDADEVSRFFKENYGVDIVLYGGSVTDENVASFTKTASIDGVLVGGASREPKQFAEIIRNT